jgi:DNA-binding NarL/FixJ family response regulator/tetratricopeptide (TPR) repeat protein
MGVRGMPETTGTRQNPVGRDRELGLLDELVRHAVAGRGGIAVVRGEPGIGKTSLVQAVVREHTDSFTRVLRGAAEEFDRLVPFAAVCDCLEASGSPDEPSLEILRLARSEGGRRDATYAVTEAVLGLVEQWCATGPVLWVLDDLQWADPASLRVLHRLGQIARQDPLLVITMCHSGETSDDVRLLLREWQAGPVPALDIELGPLDDAAMAELLEATTAGHPGPQTRTLTAEAAGNPLYLLELVGAEQGQGHSEIQAGAAHPADETAPPPAGLPAAIRRRLSALSPHTLETLQVASLLQTAFSATDLAAALRVMPSELLQPLREARRAGVIDELDDRLAFRHDAIREELANRLPLSVRNALNAQIADTLWESGAPPSAAAGHLLAAGPTAAARCTWLPEIAGRLALSSPELTAELLGPVVKAGEADRILPDERVHAALAWSLLNLGDAAGAEAVARASLAAPTPRTLEARLRWILAHACLGQGRTDRALREIRLALTGGRLDQARTARFHGLAAQCEVALGDTAASTASWQLALTSAQASGDTQATAHALAAAAAVRGRSGWVEEALAFADESATATTALGPMAGPQLAPEVIRGICLTELDRGEDAERAFEAALRLAERGTGADLVGWAYQHHARLLYLQGRWDDALEMLSAGEEFSERQDLAQHMLSLAGLIAVHRADHGALSRLLTALDGAGPANAVDLTTWGGPTWVRALAAWAENRTDDVPALMSELWPADTAPDDQRYLCHHLVPDLIALALAAGERQRAADIAASLDQYAAKRPATPALRRSARLASALVADDAEQLVTVAQEYDAAGFVFGAARAREQAAAALARRGRTARAREELTLALDCYESLKAAWDQARAEAMLRGLGIRRGVRGPRRRPKHGWEALTDTERVVADLVAEGLSNPEIGARMYLSRRTVQAHVSSILSKLGLKSRVEVATALVTHQAGGQ